MKLSHPVIGPLEVTFRKNSSRISACWKNGVAVFSFPDIIDRREIPGYIDRMAEAVAARRREVTFAENQEIALSGFTFRISRQSHQPRNVWGTIRGDVAYIEVGTQLDLDTLEVKQAVSKVMCNIARSVAPSILLPRGREIAAGLGLAPRSWAIMSGFKTMGKCSSRGDIHLSYICLFLTPELRDYIICHELAHLSEMSHSTRFHAICNAYCGGREKELVRKLNHFTFPILRR